tara:strand:- start:1720 stop:2451 length:732 start_codon:yes stop_codon:yes gene_type:complete
MRLHISHSKKYVLQTFPKSGCTSLKNLVDKVHEGELETINLRNASQVLNYDYSSLKDYFVISVVRNTYDRVISMYFNIFLGVDPLTLSFKPHLYRRYHNLGDEEAANKSFNEFLKWLGEKQFNINGDHHWNKQYLFEPTFFKVDKYINLYKINKVLPKLYEEKFSISKDKVKKILENKENVLPKKKYDIDIKLDNYNFREDSLNLDITKNGIPHKELMLTDKSINMIKKLYKEEIDYYQFKVN